MLAQLTVHDLGLIERAELELGPGLQVISGETGVGKSMLLQSMAILRGDRPRTDWIRTGCDEALVAGLFVIEDDARRARLEEVTGIPLEDGELLVERRLRREGRHSCRLNGRAVPASLLREAGPHLIEIHGQQSQLTLLEARSRLRLIDRFARLEDERSRYATLFRSTRALEAQIEALRGDAEVRAERRLSLEHLIADIEEVDPGPGERDRLEEELSLLEDGDRIAGLVSGALARLHDEEGSVVDQLGTTAREFSALGDRHRELAEFAALCSELVGSLEAGLHGLRAVADGLDIDPESLESMRRRFDRIVALEERFRRRGDDLLAYRDELRAELETLSADEGSLPELEKEFGAALADLRKRAKTLTRARERALKTLSGRITAELADLGMERATFEAIREPLEGGSWGGLDESGADRVEFIFGPNPGEPARPLGDIASGGELSRVMLSLKRTLADADAVASLVFDEVDTGVGGRLGSALGVKLQEIGVRHQVLCVTHLAQLACYGDRQFRVEKRVSRDRTVTTVEALDAERRAEEIAAMMRGDRKTERSLAEAREMLESAAQDADRARARVAVESTGEVSA